MAWVTNEVMLRGPKKQSSTMINEDKHVKIMFNRIHKMPQVNAVELYVSSEPLAEADTEEVQ